jgi:hypothetical protein
MFKGQKGTYLDATVFIDVDNKDQYDNNGMITQDAPKGEQGAILGNAQVFWSDGGQQQSAPRQQAPQQQGGQGNAPQQQGQQQRQATQQTPMPEPDFEFDDDD